MTPVRRPLIPAYGRWPLLLAAVSQCAVFWGAKAISAGWYHYDMTTALDRALPFLPWTSAIYVGAYLFWAANYILAVRTGEENGFRLLAADMLGKLVCFGAFLLVPATNIRPEIPADAPLGWLLGLVYALDTPEALFPSLHCFNSWLCWAAVRGRRDVPAGYRAFSLAFALAIAASTLTTRQHVLADAAAGLALGELSWRLAERTKLAAWYLRLWKRKSKNLSLRRG